MRFLTKQIHFTGSYRPKIWVGLTLGLFLAMIILFLEPFDTNQYESDYRTLMLLGFGILFGGAFILYSSLENFWYQHVNQIWVVWHEALSTLLFFLFSGTIIYLYNHLIINGGTYSLASHWWYCSHIVLAMIPIVAPLLIYLRQKFGQRIIPPVPDTITITGINKNESLSLKKQNLLFVRAIENYIEIHYINEKGTPSNITFRQTLMALHQQADHLDKCHRSYLVNLKAIKTISGNAQSAKIIFKQIDQQIPLSKSYYKAIKSQVM